ncbi:hypothetical protein EW146_g7337 [Bondarzewia mesenterica]|uniref:D-xylose 1-dehydrogenase (NADP(+), D-xylono-1,5-lactone-forming) n=1 Tax=Bondarzewia mesenterica TaxID=1095465 RepID=A0A4V3XE98_9AGAM|nr:hypothetical protein EW146_g7337 [Bondarzewia mesenterica]
MASVYGLCKRVYTVLYPPAPTDPSSTPLKFGILGAAAIAPIAIVRPVKNHPDAVLYGVAARDETRAAAFAKKWGVVKTYGSYQELLDDPEIDVVYNPLPNGLHYEWTMKALAAGKHVLLEKPSADTAEETRKMFAFAEKKGLVLLEAFHYRFHPATQRVKEIVDSGELGQIKSIESSLTIPSGLLKDDDIRLSYNLGGGAMMDMGCYTLSMTRYLAGADPVKILSASADTSSKFPRIDIGTSAKLAFSSQTPDDDSQITATIHANFRLPARGPFGLIPAMPKMNVRAVGTEGEVKTYGKEGNSKGKTRTEKRYGEKGNGSWTTYRYQLEAFIDKVRGRTPQHWFDAADSIANIEWIGRIYEETGLGIRPASEAEVPSA